MGWLRFLRRRQWDAERARELESYLAHEYDDNVARGMAPEAARRAARLKLGNATLVREEIYEMNTVALLESVWKDVKYGARLLGRYPAFAAVAILTLALGTGANTAIFQIVDAVRLRALPVASPRELISIGIDTHDQGRTGHFTSRRPYMTEPLWRRIQVEQQAFSSMLAWAPYTSDLASGGESRPVSALWVSGSFFETLGVHAAVGRVLSTRDDVPGCGSPGLVLSHAFWQRHFAGDPNIVGRSLSLDRLTFEIVGVTPANFFGVEVGRAFDVAAPLCAEPLILAEQSGLGRPDYWFLDLMGRLKPGWTIERASAHLAAISPQVFRDTVPPRYNAETAKAYQEFTLLARPAGTGVSSLRTTYETPLWLLLGVTGLVLLIACANLANLMLARATSREREIVVRLAIGASRLRIFRQMLAESLLLALLGTAGGVLLATRLSSMLVALLTTDRDRLFVNLVTDWRTFGFAAGLAVAACVMFGVAPALYAMGANAGLTVQAAGRSSTDRRARVGLRRALVVLQVALSLVLVAGAMLFGRTLRNLQAVDPGFHQDGVVIAAIDFRATKVPVGARRPLYDEILERVRAVPGVQAAATAGVVPLSGAEWNNQVLIGGVAQPGLVYLNGVSEGYFSALGIPILAGRDFDRTDTPSSQRVAIVSQLFAEKYFSGNAIGRSFEFDAPPGKPRPVFHIIGLVSDTKYTDLREPFFPMVFFPASQDDSPLFSLQILVRTAGTAATVTGAVTHEITARAPSATVQYDTMQSQIRDSMISERLMATLSGFFGVLAVLIATIGLYGVISYLVARRRREIGVRLALGADSRHVVRMVVGEAAALLTAGLAAGAVGAVLTARYASSLLYGLKPSDPVTVALSVTALGSVGLIASWVPARRASRLDPATVLREDQA